MIKICCLLFFPIWIRCGTTIYNLLFNHCFYENLWHSCMVCMAYRVDRTLITHDNWPPKHKLTIVRYKYDLVLFRFDVLFPRFPRLLLNCQDLSSWYQEQEIHQFVTSYPLVSQEAVLMQIIFISKVTGHSFTVPYKSFKCQAYWVRSELKQSRTCETCSRTGGARAACDAVKVGSKVTQGSIMEIRVKSTFSFNLL